MNKKCHVLCVVCRTVFLLENNIGGFNFSISDIVNAETHNVPGERVCRPFRATSSHCIALLPGLPFVSFSVHLASSIRCARVYHPVSSVHGASK
jgi:hypothetical protein